MAKDYELPYMYGQPLLIENWVEKKGLLPTFEELCYKYDIKTRSPEGFSPWEFCNDAINDIKSYLDERSSSKILILYWGDLDPSGIQIYRSIREQLDYFNVDYKLIRVGVTIEQIRKFNLPKTPIEEKTLKRIHNDPRYKKYIVEFGEIFCELDSFVSLAPEQFKKVLNNIVKRNINEEILNWRNKKSEEMKKVIEKVINNYSKELEELKKLISGQMPKLQNGFSF